MNLLDQKRAELAAKREALKACFASMKDAAGNYKTFTAEEDTKFQADLKTFEAEIPALEAEIKRLEDMADLEAKNDDALKAFQRTERRFIQPGGDDECTGTKKIEGVPATARITRSGMKNFLMVSDSRAEAALKAYRFGQWFRAAMGRRPDAMKYCQEHGIPLLYVSEGDAIKEFKAHNEISNTAGAVLVPEEFEDTLIDLREKFGVFRRNAKLVPMQTDTKRIPRRTGGLTAYFIGDNTTITESTKAWDAVMLVAKKIGVLAKYSNELGEDAIIDIGNDLAGEIAYAFAKLEDQCGFIGDGTSTYGGMTGVVNALSNLSATKTQIAGLKVQTGTGAYSTTIADFETVVSLLPQYADSPNTCWFAHRTIYWQVMVPLMVALGGVSLAEVSQIGRNIPFLGYPVEITQAMSSVYAANQVYALFGDLTLAAKMGDRRQTTIAMSEHLNFAEDEIAIRGTERFDIVVHDVGNASATASLKVPGPIVGIIGGTS